MSNTGGWLGRKEVRNTAMSITATQQWASVLSKIYMWCWATGTSMLCYSCDAAVQEHWYQCIMILLLYGLRCSQHWCCSFQATTMVDANALFQLVPICNRSELFLWSVVCTVLYFVQSVMCTALCSYALTLIVHKLHTSAQHCAQHKDTNCTHLHTTVPSTLDAGTSDCERGRHVAGRDLGDGNH